MLYTSCAFPRWGKLLLVGYMVSMLILFSNFYIKTYISKRRSRSAQSSQKSVANGTTTKDLNMNGKNGVTNGHTNGNANGLTQRHISSNGKHVE